MRKIFFALLTVLNTGFLALILLAPSFAEAKTKNTAPPTNQLDSAPSDLSATTVEAPTNPTVPAAPVAPTPPVATSAPVIAPAATALPSDVVKVGNLVLHHISAHHSGSSLDLYFSIKNEGKGEERLTGAGSPWDVSDIVQVVANQDGKQQEMPISMALPAGQTVDYSPGNTWIRVKNIKTIPSGATTFPISFYFRSSPNANLLVSLNDNGHKSIGSTILDWFK